MEKRYIFDADTHVSPYSNFDKSINACQWEERMERAGVAHAIVWLLPQGVVDVTESNRYIGREAQKNKRMVPFGWANIREGAEKAREDARLCLEEYGCAGVKLNGAQNEYYIDCPEAMSVMEVVAARNGMIAFHIGADYPDFTDPIRAERAARAFPDTKFLMVHMGGAGEPDVSQRVIETAARNPNMYLVGSAIPAAKVKAAIDTLGPDRILFGSDTPFYDAADVIREYDRMLSGYDEEVRRKIMGENAGRLLDFQCRACDVRRGGCRQTSIHPCSLCWENIFYLFFLPSFPFFPSFPSLAAFLSPFFDFADFLGSDFFGLSPLGESDFLDLEDVSFSAEPASGTEGSSGAGLPSGMYSMISLISQPSSVQRVSRVWVDTCMFFFSRPIWPALKL